MTVHAFLRREKQDVYMLLNRAQLLQCNVMYGLHAWSNHESRWTAALALEGLNNRRPTLSSSPIRPLPHSFNSTADRRPRGLHRGLASHASGAIAGQAIAPIGRRPGENLPSPSTSPSAGTSVEARLAYQGSPRAGVFNLRAMSIQSPVTSVLF